MSTLQRMNKTELNGSKPQKKFDGHHQHGQAPVFLYFIALTLSFVGLLLAQQWPVVANILFTLSIILASYHVVIIEGLGHCLQVSLEQKKFIPNAHLLMGLAALGACLIGEYWEGSLLILIFAGAHFLEDYAEGKSRREISQLMALTPTRARRLTGPDQIEEVEVDQLEVGDQIQVRHGDQVPIDGKIVSGRTAIDQSSINGESLAVEKGPGDLVYASTINQIETIIVEVKKESKDSVFAKIIELVEQNQSNPTRAGDFIQQFEPSYVRLVLTVVFLFILLSPLFMSWSYYESAYRGIVLLVSASPCALAAATVSASLSASSYLAKQGVLSKGSSYISQFGQIQAIAFDKTGTLTQGVPQLTDFFCLDDAQKSKIIDLIVALEKESNHPLADAILDSLQARERLNLNVDHQIGRGLEATYQGKSYRIGKPLSFNSVAQPLIDLNHQWSNEGKTVVYFAEDEKVLAALALMDLARETASMSLDYFKNQSIHTSLITGDSLLTAQAVAEQVGIDQVYAGVMPEEKAQIVSDLQDRYQTVAMVGDGVNDAPALSQADLGIAMGEGTDVALEVADLVLMKNELQKLTLSHQTAQKMNRIIKQNIIFSLLVVVTLVVMAVTGFNNIAISVLIHEGSTLLVILNGLRLLL